MDFNLPTCPERFANVALALGAATQGNPLETARRAVERIHELARQSGVPMNLSDLRVPRSAVPGMAEAAMQVKRLLKNNPRDLTMADAVWVYEQAFQPREQNLRDSTGGARYV
jgi:alcohol dehydrogenase